MKICRKGFNVYLILALASLSAIWGCQAPDKHRKKGVSTLCLYLETETYMTNRAQIISIGRSTPVHLTVERVPFLCEGNIKSARVIDSIGGFALRIECERQGTWLLEEYTTSNRGKRFAVFSRFATPPDRKLNEGRWIAAPRIMHRISDGVFVFTPDTTREEAESIAHGLSSIGSQLEKDSKYW